STTFQRMSILQKRIPQVAFAEAAAPQLGDSRAPGKPLFRFFKLLRGSLVLFLEFMIGRNSALLIRTTLEIRSAQLPPTRSEALRKDDTRLSDADHFHRGHRAPPRTRQ